MKFVPKGPIAEFLLIAALGCCLAFLVAWLTAMFAVIKLSQGISLSGLALVLLWCAVVGAGLVKGICASCALFVGRWRKHCVAHAIRLKEAMDRLHAATNQEQLEALRYYHIRVFKSFEEIPAGGKDDVQCCEVSNFLSPMLLGFNKFFALGSPEYCCDVAQISEIVEENQMRWCGESREAPGGDAVKFKREIEELKKKCRETSANFTAASGREGKLKREIEQMEAHMHILVTLANKATKEFTHPLAKHEITRQYKEIGKALGVETVPVIALRFFARRCRRNTSTTAERQCKTPETPETLRA